MRVAGCYTLSYASSVSLAETSKHAAEIDLELIIINHLTQHQFQF